MHHGQSVFRKGFALPTVLIASVVLLSILAVSVSATTAVRTTLKNQYYAQLAQIAGEAGVAYAKACLAANSNVPQWDADSPLTPTTDCTGAPLTITSPTIEHLVVAGGGGGGGNCNTCGGAGGGGAGGLVYTASAPITTGSYPVTVGAGGAGGAASNSATGNGANGSNSSFNGITAIGGGGGRPQSGAAGAAGGSGGGGSGGSSPAPGAGGAGTVGQGSAGGAGTSTNNASGGGGGAGAAGATNPGHGGVGLAYSISGTSVFYAGGGGGGAHSTFPVGNGGNGGGGSGANSSGTGHGNPGTANTGGGGGGANGSTKGGTGGTGGSGVVIVSYPAGSLTATGGTITTVNGKTIHTFTSSGTFSVTGLQDLYNCPTDPRCSVTVNGNVRSSFSVGLPTLDSDGRAVTIPYSGYVELTRTSNGAVWRTITQPSVQAAVVPDLCSGAASSGLGWSNAVKAATQDAFSPTPSAQTITLANSSLNAGYMFFRKDFTVTEAGTYNVSAFTPTTSDLVEIFIDGTRVISSVGSLVSGTINLTPGCHIVVAKLTNGTIVPRTTRFTASVQKNDDITPVVATNSTWRVTAGDTKHYSMTGYYANTFLWTPVRVYSNPAWTENYSARSISTTHSYDGSNNYPASYAYFRDNRTITVSSATEARVAVLCDDACVVYLDGEQIILTGNATNRSYVDVTLQPGDHKFGVRLQNTGGPSSFYFSVFRKTDNAILSQSDSDWSAANFWTTSQEFYSYDTAYIPSPSVTTPVTARVLVVGGGGSGGGGWQGGGGGGGGVVYNAAYPLQLQSYTVTVGAGGAGGSITTFNNGGYSLFGDIYALGGGAGAGEPSGTMTYPMFGGSGGGGAHPTQATISSGFIGQGNRGGTGLTGNPFVGGGGGGAGAVGQNATTTNAGAGGAGVSNSITGSAVVYGGGGGGSKRDGSGQGAGGSGGGGAGSTTGVAGTANTGGGGGAGSNPSSAAGPSGAGGSGVVIIAYLTGTMTATGGTITTSGGYTIHRFTTSGTFTVTSIP